MITADGGGSNSYRSRLWKVALQGLADRLELRLKVCHFPPGTSKWNKIEHRLFSYITSNWRGQPLVSHEAIVTLSASTTTKTGLIVQAALDTNVYETGLKASDGEMARLRLTPCDFSRRMELHHSSAQEQKLTRLFFRGSLSRSAPRCFLRATAPLPRAVVLHHPRRHEGLILGLGHQ